MTAKPKPKILWITNLPAPYRFPIWTRIARELDLKVAFLLKQVNWRKWSVPENVSWDYEYLSFNSLRLQEFDLITSISGSKRILQGVDVVIIGGWELPFYWRTHQLAKKKNIPIIQFYESTQASHRFNNILIRSIRSAILSNANYIVTIGSESTKAVEAMGIPNEKIITLFNPVDVSWFHSYAQSHRIQQSTGHSFIYVGQLIERKNVASVIRAFAAIRNEFDTLTIAGVGPLEQSLIELVKDNGLSGSVSFVGHQNQEALAELYATSNTLILASTNEVWGLVVNEALASGLHVIVSDLCGVSDFIKDMEGAYICTTSVESISLKMHESRRNHTGAIKDPEILKYTPERFAEQLLSTINIKIKL